MTSETNLREYIISLHQFDDLESFYADMETEGGNLYIPSRAVDCYIRRPISRNTHYMLSDQEAEQIRQDPRVLAVELTPAELGIERTPSWTQTSSLWSKSNTLVQGQLNWGLLRVTEGSQRSNWGTGGTTEVTGTVTVPFSGKNVDVVIMDGRIEPGHPEFAKNTDGTGGTRVNQYNWYELTSQVTGGTNGNYSYTPVNPGNDYHGAVVAGISAGNTHGWARDANLFNIYAYNADPQFDYVRAWHNNKPDNPLTGRKNPTIINCSFSYRRAVTLSSLTSIVYRGTTYTGPFTEAQVKSYGLYTDGINVTFVFRYEFERVDIEECIAAGIIVVFAAGNESSKIDVTGGQDYNNSLTTSGDTYRYNQGHSDQAQGAISVGAIEAQHTGTTEKKASYSSAGPGVDVFAPGSNIRSSSKSDKTPNVADARNLNYVVGSFSGTSYAAPQVTGLLATMLEVTPAMTPAAAMTYVTDNAKTGQINDTAGGVTDLYALQGASNRYLFAKYPATITITPSTTTVISLQNVIYTITMTDVADGSLVYLTESGTSISTNFADGLTQKQLTITGGSANWIRTANTVSATPRTSIMQLRTGGYDGNIQATASTVTVASSQPTYSLIPAALSVNEGTPLIITVNTLNVAANTRLYWAVNGTVADFNEPSGSILIDNVGTGSFSVTPTQDNLIEPAETFTISIRTILSNPPADPVATSDPITINATVSQSQLLAQKITPTVYNDARTQVAGVLGVTTTGQVGATQGYGQVLASSAVSQHEQITEAHLDNLKLDIVKTRKHQSDTDPNLVNVALGNIALADVFDSYSSFASICNILKNQIGPNQLATESYTQTATYSAYTGTPNTGGGWKDSASYETTITFATADAARYFFNAGSSFKFSASRSGGTIAPTVGLNQNTSWTNLLSEVSNDVNTTFVKNNFYALSTAYSTFYNKNSTGIYSANYYRISAKCNVADNSYGGATVITFKVEFVDAFNFNNQTNYDGVDGTFESVIKRSMPKGPGLGGELSIAAPTSRVHNPLEGFIKVGTPIYKTATYSIVATPTSVSEASATINFEFTATNYNVPNTVTWTIAATTVLGLSDFVIAGTGWTSRINDLGYQVLERVTNLTAQSTFEASITTASIVTNPDALTEGTESFVVFATPAADGSGGGLESNTVTITVTDSSKTATPGYSIVQPSATPQLSCIPGEGLGAAATWTINSVAFTGEVPLVIYGIYLNISNNVNINAYKMTLWDGTVLTETTTTFYTLPTPKSVANGTGVTFNVQVGSTSGAAGTGTVKIHFRTNAGTFDGEGPATNGPSFNTAERSVSVQVVAPAPALSITANPASVNYTYVSGSTGEGRTEITITNTGNARVTLSDWNVSNPGGGTVVQGLIGGLLGAGNSKYQNVTYSTTSAYNGTSVISVTGTNSLIGTVNASRNVAVNATQAFGIISQSITGTTSAVIYTDQTFNVVITNSGLAPLTVTNITLSGATNMTISSNPAASQSISIGAGLGQNYFFTWKRTRIGSSTVVATITSNTGGVTGTITSTSATFTGTATTPTFVLTGSGPGAVTGTSWLSNDGVLPKEGSIRLEFAGLEPNTNCMAAMFWTQDQTSSGYGGKGVWATSAETRGSLITDPKLVPITENVTSSTGTYIPWPGTGPNAADGYGAFETRYWRAGRNRFYVQLPVGKNDAGVQQWYTNSRSGTSAGSQWAITTSFPEAACGSNQTWIGFTVIPNITWGFGFYEGVQGDTFAYVLRGAASHASIATSALTFTVDTGTTTAVPWSPPAVMTEETGQASFTFNTGVSGPYGSQQAAPVGTYNYMRPISPSGWGDATIYQGVGRTFDVLSPAFYITDGVFPGGWGIGSAASPGPDLNVTGVGTNVYFRRVGAAGNGVYSINVFAYADDAVEVYCNNVFMVKGIIAATPQVGANKSVTITDGYSHWRFQYTNTGGPGYFGVAVYLGPNLYFALSNPASIKDASKW